MFEVHDQVPHFHVLTIDGQELDYGAQVWQRANLLLVSLTDREPDAAAAFVSEVSARAGELRNQNTALVVTRETIAGVARPSVLLADRWGEIQTVHRVDDQRRWPAVDDLIESIGYLEMRCPECEGESR